MSVKVEVRWDKSKAQILEKGKVASAIKRALSKAGRTAVRDMRAEASKRIRARKRLKIAAVNKSLSTHVQVKGDIEGMEFRLDVSGKPVKLAEYPHRAVGRATKQNRSRRTGKFTSTTAEGRRGGVSVEVNKGKRTILPHAFIARTESGHEGIFERVSKHSLPVRELLGSRPVDALLHAGEADAVAARGAASLNSTFDRLLPLELAKGEGSK